MNKKPIKAKKEKLAIRSSEWTANRGKPKTNGGKPRILSIVSSKA